MVSAEDADRTGLRPFLTLLLDECDGCSDGEVIEGVIQHAGAVEIDALFTSLDEP